MTTYLLDANVFIQGKNLHYGFDFCPAFWDWLDEAHAAGAVHSIDSVRTELLAGSDELATWARQRSGGFFLAPTAATVPSLQATSNWAAGAGYEPSAVSTFLQVADYYLVAQAHQLQYTVVTHEVVSPSVKRIKIPNACLGLDVKYVTPYAMLRAEKARRPVSKSSISPCLTSRSTPERSAAHVLVDPTRRVICRAPRRSVTCATCRRARS